ncbi:WD40-repeat-containing domain protein [Elsinoe ampelina]|uniref:WD40-repeat-containing domain protein n=1 Tax=Elsinoe ampelina TaxID=302913 RepID=A0A6A6FXG9_9PEZI|nr:WD40-repeat-containing domain protein [Elsinoe ampelina]
MASVAKQTATSNVSLPPDTYIYALARLSNSIACIASDDTIGLLDPTTLKVKHKISKCHKSVTSLTAVTGSQTLATAGRDGLVKVWDERKEASLSTLSIRICGCIRMVSFFSCPWCTTRSSLGFYLSLVMTAVMKDVRNITSPLRSYLESHNDTIATLSFSPSSTNRLLSSSTDALLTLFDTTQAEEDDAIQQIFNHSAAVHLASHLSQDEICAISSDEALSVYEISKPEDVENEDVHSLLTAYGDVREELKASYVAQILQSAGETWVASGHLEEKTLRLTPLVRGEGKTKWRFDHSRALSLPDGHGEEVVRDVLLDEVSKTVISCGEDGMVRVWAVPDAGADGMEIEEDEAESKKEKKRRKKEKREKERFKPY